MRHGSRSSGDYSGRRSCGSRTVLPPPASYSRWFGIRRGALDTYCRDNTNYKREKLSSNSELVGEVLWARDNITPLSLGRWIGSPLPARRSGGRAGAARQKRAKIPLRPAARVGGTAWDRTALAP